jgi:hypothetical protein
MITQIGFRKLWICCWLGLSCATILAQNNAIKNTKTDKKYANTTEVYKKDGATDTDVLGEISTDYGLGDVVRISVAPPPPPPVEELDKAKPTTMSSNIKPNIPTFGTSGVSNQTTTDKSVNDATDASTPNAETSTYTNTSKDNLNKNNTPSVSTEKDMPIASAKTPKKISGDLPPPVVENGADMSNFNKNKRENADKKTEKTTSVKVAGNTKTMKSNSTTTRKSYNGKSYKKLSWFPFFGKKTTKPARRKSSGKEVGCYKF